MAIRLRNRLWFVIMSCTCRFIFAVTFIISGILKSIDPWSTILTMEAYLSAYEISLPDLVIESAAIGLGVAELVIGCMLLFNAYTRLITLVSLLVISMFTVLTLLSATIIPVEDCGCFGKFINLSPWESFAKNMILLPMALCFWYHYRKDRIGETWFRDLMITIVFVASSLGFSIYNYLHLPILDTTPYSTGTDLQEVIEQAYGGEQAELENSIIVYRNIKTGELVESPLSDTLTWHTWEQDKAQWEWFETRVEESGEMPTVLDFYICDKDGKDVTMDIIAKPKLYMIFVEELTYDDDIREKFTTVERYAQVNGGEVVYITPENLSLANTTYPCYNMDTKIMKTVLRARYGLVVLEEGTIAEKYRYSDIPY